MCKLLDITLTNFMKETSHGAVRHVGGVDRGGDDDDLYNLEHDMDWKRSKSH